MIEKDDAAANQEKASGDYKYEVNNLTVSYSDYCKLILHMNDKRLNHSQFISYKTNSPGYTMKCICSVLEINWSPVL